MKLFELRLASPTTILNRLVQPIPPNPITCWAEQGSRKVFKYYNDYRIYITDPNSDEVGSQHKLKNELLLTEGWVTLVDAYQAGAVLLGLLLNALIGWWWADPLADLVIVYHGIREGWHDFKEARNYKLLTLRPGPVRHS
jgi:hypothetical protein